MSTRGIRFEVFGLLSEVSRIERLWVRSGDRDVGRRQGLSRCLSQHAQDQKLEE
jgi:hypothetical protein